ncbi:glutamate--tRNA ligase [soil metagenome]
MSGNSIRQPVVTRFAPSPTGYLHVGGARTALFNWLLARHTGGKYLLRIEDTDLARSTEQATVQLLDDLRWLGLNWDNPDLVFQSKRVEEYNRIIDDLLARGLAYKAYETREELDALRTAAEKQKRQFVYRRRELSAEEIGRFESARRPFVVRLAMPVQEYRFTDLVLGEIALPPEEVQDFVIRKTDGMPTYHFAVVIDDEAMQVTHVLRGQEHVKNTFNHIVLQAALGYRRPTYAHLTTIQNPDGSKMGKRDRDKAVRQRATEWLKSSKTVPEQLATLVRIDAPRLQDWLKDSKKQLDIQEQEALMHVIGLRNSELPEVLVHDFRKNGYLPETLLNFIALLGWGPGGNKEHMTCKEMIELFSIDRIGKANPKFDRAKLIAFNTEAAAASSEDRLLMAFKDYLAANPESPANGASDEQLRKLIHMKKGFRTFREVDEPARFLFVADDQIAFDPPAVEKALEKNSGEGMNVLRDVLPIFAAIEDWNLDALDAAVKSYCEQKSLGLGKVAQPIRVAVSGSMISPPIFESLEFLGKTRTLNRIKRCLEITSGPH